MHELYDLVYVLNRYLVRDIDIITNPKRRKTKEESRYWEFYVGLQKKQWGQDEDKMADYFGYPSKHAKGFRRLKDGLKERLLNCLLFLQPEQIASSDYARKHLLMSKAWLLSDILLQKDALSMYVETAEEGLRLALELKHSIAVAAISNNLKKYYAQRETHTGNFEKLTQICQQATEKIQQEYEAQDTLQQFIYAYSDMKTTRFCYPPELVEKLQQYESENLKSTYTMTRIHRLQLLVHTKTKAQEWQQAEELIDQALSLIVSQPNLPAEFQAMFMIQRAVCLTSRGEHKRALDNTLLALAFLVDGTCIWFKAQEVRVITLFQAQQYEVAQELTLAIRCHDRFGTLAPLDQETWRLYEGYLYWIEKSIHQNKRPAFRLHKWLNEMPIHAQDKRGGYIPLIILQVLYRLTEKGNNDTEDILRHIEALRRYMGRNFDTQGTRYRTDCFIALLQLLIRYRFDKRKLIEVAQPWLKKLSSVTSDGLTSEFELEIVPYERQWAWILEKL